MGEANHMRKLVQYLISIRNIVAWIPILSTGLIVILNHYFYQEECVAINPGSKEIMCRSSRIYHPILLVESAFSVLDVIFVATFVASVIFAIRYRLNKLGSLGMLLGAILVVLYCYFTIRYGAEDTP